MIRPCCPAGLFALSVLLALAPTASCDGPPAPVIERFWAITDTVLDHQVDSPARQEMLLGAVRNLYQAAGETPPADLVRKVSAVATREQFVALIRDVWPKVKGDAGKALTDGALARVPGRARVMTEQERLAFEANVNNRYVGTGIQLRMDPKTKFSQIVVPIRGGPANKAGVKTNDLIVAVDGKSMEGLTLAQIVDRIRGDEGTDVSFTVRQPDSDEKREIKMTRSVVPFEHTFGFRPGKKTLWDFRIKADEPIGYVYVTATTSSIVHELREVDRQMKEEGVRAVVLDLRYTFGFRMQHAAQAADALLDGGTLWRVRDAAGRLKEYKADRDCLFRDMPMVVLVDSTTTGEAGPLLAAALQDSGRAVLVGDLTGFGGYITGLVDLPGEQGALSLRTGVVERSRPATIEPQEGLTAGLGWRVQPDHYVRVSRKEADAVVEWMQDKGMLEPKLADKPPVDAQLVKAVEVLRAALKKNSKASGN